jgi:anti-anti-sigma factor
MLTENQIKSASEIAVLRLSGRFDAHKKLAASAWASRQRQNGTYTLVMDLGEVNFVDSVALTWAMQEIGQCRKEAGDLMLYNPTPVVRIILELTNLEQEFHFWSPDANLLTNLHTITTIL